MKNLSEHPRQTSPLSSPWGVSVLSFQRTLLINAADREHINVYFFYIKTSIVILWNIPLYVVFSWFTLVCLGQGLIFLEARHYTSLPSGKFRSNALGSTGLSLLWQAPY